MAKLDDAVANGLASLSIASSRHAKSVLLLVLLLTGVFGYGMSTITTNVDVADVLPRGNYNTEAAHNLTAKFRSTFTQQVTLQLHVDERGDRWRSDNAKLTHRQGAGLAGTPGGALAPDPRNITDEVYVRATAELVEYIHAHTDFSRAITISNLYALLNWTIAGGNGSGGTPAAPESAFSVPGYRTREDAARYQQVDAAVKAAILDAVDAIASPKWDHSAALFMPAADNKLHTRTLGEQMLQARDDFVAAVERGETEFTVFGKDNKPLFTVDLPVANAHSSKLVEQDTVRLMPLVALFILACLYVAFRNLRAVAVSFAALGLGVVWTYGLIGYMRIPLNTLNITIVPLVMGVGIDYAIHILNEFAEHKAHGVTDAEAFRLAGRRSGTAMLIATLTTVGGLLVLAFSPSVLIAQLGIAAAFALGVMYLLTLTFIPAAVTILRGSTRMGAKFTPSRLMPALARAVHVGRVPVVLLLLTLAALAYFPASEIGREAFGDPGRNYLPDDPIRREHEQGLKYFYGAADSDEKANILAFSGRDILTPEAMLYYRTVEANLKAQPRVIPDTLRTLPFFIETWLTVKGGPACAVGNVGASNLPPELKEILEGLPDDPAIPCNRQVTFPANEAALREEVDAMFASPFRELASLIVNHPTNDMAAMTFSVRAASYEQAEEVWHQVWGAVRQANQTFGGGPPGDIKVAFVGNTATNYLFIAEELPWLNYMAMWAMGILGFLVALLTRSVKITLVVLALSFLTSWLWVALLPAFGIGLAITLTLPFAFIVAIGTDYGVHFMWNIRQTGNAREVFGSTGKAVLFSAITTVGAFVFFVFVQNVAVARTMVATLLAFVVIFVVTLLVVPAFFRVEPEGVAAPAGRGPRTGSGARGPAAGGTGTKGPDTRAPGRAAVSAKLGRRRTDGADVGKGKAGRP